jgi:branched-chain amino acid transport system ATP-binding protein
MTGTAHPLLEAASLVAGYLPEVDILNGCDLRLAPGEIVGIIGPNGAGKSTLVKVLFGLLPVRRGRVSLRGEDVTGLPAHEMVGRGVSYVPQRTNVFPRLTVQENLRMGARLKTAALRARSDSILELFPHLRDRLHQRAGLLSGGERQMVAMARALMMEPSVLLLDEPSAGLSPANQDEVFDRIGEVNGAGVAVVMVEQNARRCLETCHRGYVLDQGANAYTGTGLSLLEDPRVVELYLGTLAQER